MNVGWMGGGASGITDNTSADTSTINENAIVANDGHIMAISPARGWVWFNEFCSTTAGAEGVNTLSSVGTIDRGPNDDETNHPGTWRIKAVTAATNDYAILEYGGGLHFNFAAGDTYTLEGLIYIDDLATAGEDYLFRTGFGDTTTGIAGTDECCFVYDRSTSANWIVTTANNGTRTSTTTSTVVTENAWNKLKVVVTGVTSAEFIINGTSVATHTTNIPNGAARKCGPSFSIRRVTAGSTSRQIAIDYWHLMCLLGTAR